MTTPGEAEDAKVSGPGVLAWVRVRAELVAAPVASALAGWPFADRVLAASIDAELADTAAFCECYGVAPAVSANCVVIAGKRGEVVSYAACVVLATTRADVNGTVRRLLGARKASFAPMDEAVALSSMEYGGITPIGLPAQWPIFVDAAVVAAGTVVIGSGLRSSKLALPGQALLELPHARLVEDLAR